jgi:hypothetical protein
MVQCGHRAGLPLKALGKLLLGDFDRDDPVQACIARLVDLSHAAGADERKDFVRAEFVADGQGHLGVQAKFSRSRRFQLSV